jgi:hypothetical protein
MHAKGDTEWCTICDGINNASSSEEVTVVSLRPSFAFENLACALGVSGPLSTLNVYKPGINYVDLYCLQHNSSRICRQAQHIDSLFRKPYGSVAQFGSPVVFTSNTQFTRNGPSSTPAAPQMSSASPSARHVGHSPPASG